jgi:hypothetical protein
MTRLFIVVVFLFVHFVAFSQVNKTEELKAKMTLKANTRDKSIIVKDNLHNTNRIFIYKNRIVGKDKNINTAKETMVLRLNTRDKVSNFKNNKHDQQVQQRRKQILENQKKIQNIRMHKIQQRNIYRQRLFLQRRLRQHAIRQKHLQGR